MIWTLRCLYSSGSSPGAITDHYFSSHDSNTDIIISQLQSGNILLCKKSECPAGTVGGDIIASIRTSAFFQRHFINDSLTGRRHPATLLSARTFHVRRLCRSFRLQCSRFRDHRASAQSKHRPPLYLPQTWGRDLLLATATEGSGLRSPSAHSTFVPDTEDGCHL